MNNNKALNRDIRFIRFLFLQLLIVLSFVALYVSVSSGKLYSSIVLSFLGVVALYVFYFFYHSDYRKVTHFFSSISHLDFSQRFTEIKNRTASPSESKDLEQLLDDLTLRLQKELIDKQANTVLYKTVVDFAPVAIMCLAESGHLRLLNSRARRVLAASPDHINWLESTQPQLFRDLTALCGGFAGQSNDELGRLATHHKKITNVVSAGLRYKALLVSHKIQLAGDELLVVTLENIQSEISEAEYRASFELSRAISHEIMNSLTPIISLSQTCTALVDDLSPSDEITELNSALTTIEHRATHLMSFVESYRKLAKLPAPIMSANPVMELFDRLNDVFRQECERKSIALSFLEIDRHTYVVADASQLQQAMVNILKNALEACEGIHETHINVFAQCFDDTFVLSVEDSGVGIAEPLRAGVHDTTILAKSDKAVNPGVASKPGISTKPGGSGIGLALARQIMHAHGGMLVIENREPRGTVCKLVFKQLSS